MKVLNLLTAGKVGGIEVLCRDIARQADFENVFCFRIGEGLIYEEMLASGFAVYSLSDAKKSLPQKLNYLKKIAEDCDIVVVHHDDPFLEMYYLALMRVFPSKRFVSMVHHCYDPVADNLGYGFLKRSMKSFLIASMFKKSDKLIFVSGNGYKSYLPKFKVDKEKVSIVYNGVSEKLLAAGQLCKKDYVEPIKIAYVGRLVEIKAVDKLIEAFAALDEGCQLFVVGDGPCRKQLEEQASRVKARITFCGFQKDVTKYLADSVIFVYPSKTEIFGISIVEAMAFGNICVASNVGGIPEIIADGENGILNIDNTTEGLVAAINKAIDIVKNQDLYECMQQKARETANRFSFANMISELKKIYVELVKDNDEKSIDNRSAS